MNLRSDVDFVAICEIFSSISESIYDDGFWNFDEYRFNWILGRKLFHIYPALKIINMKVYGRGVLFQWTLENDFSKWYYCPYVGVCLNANSLILVFQVRFGFFKPFIGGWSTWSFQIFRNSIWVFQCWTFLLLPAVHILVQLVRTSSTEEMPLS